MNSKRTPLLVTAIILLTASLFLVDLLTPLGFEVWLPYIAVILMSLWLPHRRHTYWTAALCTVLIVCGMYLSPPGNEPWMDISNRVLAGIVFWVTAAAGLAARRTRELEKANLKLEEEISRRERLEAQLLRTQRLESVGVLAGGIAHDFNNLLTPILMSINLLREDRPEDERRHLLTTLQASAQRGADMVRQLLAFAGGMEGERVPVQLRHVLKEISGILEHTLPHNIRIEATLPRDLRHVLADATQFSQVVMNLCVNARDAMPGGGVLTIAAENLDLAEDDLPPHPDASPGPYLRITVADTGTGIPTDVQDRVFDPFFTTKEKGKGTGLGLSTVLGIVRGHGGFIQVSSEVGRGSRFEVYLPAHLPALRVADARAEEVADGQGELILLVDDERLILDTVKTTLERHGYRVVTAGDGEEALAVYDRHQGKIGAVLLDMMMPGMDGPETLVALRSRDSELPVIASSGVPSSKWSAKQPGAQPQTFLAKPYNDEQLLTALTGVLHVS